MFLTLRDIKKCYPRPKGIFGKSMFPVLKGVSLDLNEGECLGVIGESGSGKSTLGRLILGLEKADSGTISIQGHSDRTRFQNQMSVVFQDYTSSVNPRFRVKKILNEALMTMKLTPDQLRNRMVELLESVGLDESFLTRHPHELSGGQLQRVCIARALSTNPRFIVLDEAVSSLDASVQLQILELLKQLKEEFELSYLFITHDLITITYICDRVLFFKNGSIIEEVETMSSLGEVTDPYSRKLLLNV